MAILKVGDIVQYVSGKQDGVLPDTMKGEVREVLGTVQGPKKCRVVTNCGHSGLVEEFRLEKISVIFG